MHIVTTRTHAWPQGHRGEKSYPNGSHKRISFVWRQKANSEGRIWQNINIIQLVGPTITQQASKKVSIHEKSIKMVKNIFNKDHFNGEQLGNVFIFMLLIKIAMILETTIHLISFFKPFKLQFLWVSLLKKSQSHQINFANSN